jgi:serine protease Do
MWWTNQGNRQAAKDRMGRRPVRDLGWAVLWLALVPITSLPVLCAQSQAPKAHSTSIFNGPRSYLGVGVIDDMTDERARSLGLKEPQGVEVTSIAEDSPAAKAGVKKGDVILEYNGQRVEGGEQFVRMVQETPTGRKAELTVWRNGAKQTLTAIIGSRQERALMFSLPAPPFPPSTTPMIPDTPHDMLSWRSTLLGVDTEGLNSQLAEFFGVKEGVLVRSVIKGSAGDTAGLKAGDVITKIDGQTISSARNISALLWKSGKNVTLTVVRNHKEITLNVKLATNLQRFDDLPGYRPQTREIL